MWSLWTAVIVCAGAQATGVIQETADLLEARRGFETHLLREDSIEQPLLIPPDKVFSVVRYDAPSGPTAAYLSHPGERWEDGAKRPAILWLTGGFPTARGGSDPWTDLPHDNDQSAAAFRHAGVVMMFPTVRGTASNPGYQELMMGEVDDVLAATEYLRSLDHVDPDRVYLGGHSTGATLALLVAESTDVYRAVFAFGPAAEFANYGTEGWPFNMEDSREFRLRSPLHFLTAITSPTYVIEGASGRSAEVRQLDAATENPRVRCTVIRDCDHFATLAPINRMLAAKVARHRDGPFDVSSERIAEAYVEFWRGQREARDLRVLADLRAAGAQLGDAYTLRFVLAGWNQLDVEAAADDLRDAGFRYEAVEETDLQGEPYFKLAAFFDLQLDPESIFAASGIVRATAKELDLEDEGWMASPQEAERDRSL